MARTAAKLCQNAFQTIPHFSFFDANKFFSTNILARNFVFSQFLQGFGGARRKTTTKSISESNFASDAPILRSVRPKIGKKRSYERTNDDVRMYVRLRPLASDCRLRRYGSGLRPPIAAFGATAPAFGLRLPPPAIRLRPSASDCHHRRYG